MLLLFLIIQSSSYRLSDSTAILRARKNTSNPSQVRYSIPLKLLFSFILHTLGYKNVALRAKAIESVPNLPLFLVFFVFLKNIEELGRTGLLVFF